MEHSWRWLEGESEARPWQAFYDDEVEQTLEYPDATMFRLFERSVKANPNRVATWFFGAKIRYQELGELVRKFANALASLGVKRGDRVALILPNMPAYPIAHFAVMRLGGVLVPTNPLYVERELEHQLNDSGAETVIILDKLVSRLEKVRSRTPVQRVIVTGVQDFLPRILSFLYRLKNRDSVTADPGQDRFLYKDLVAQRFPETEPEEVASTETAIFLYTGGTTGVSKGAVLTHRNLVVNVRQTRNWLAGFSVGKETLLCVLPFFHSYGMTTGMHLAAEAQGTMVLVPRFDLPEVVKRIKQHKPTIFCGVPSMYNAISRYSGIKPEDVNSIRLCISGGAALTADIQERFETLTGAKLVEGFGLSETSPVALANPIFGHRKIGTIGLPISDTDARIVDPETREPLAVGEVGELAIRGPQVMAGYWNMPEETDRVLQDGWLHTGDLAKADSEGFISIVDRKKDMLISAGMNVYPREIEEVLLGHPQIAEVAVVGVPSRVREEVVKAFVVTEPGTELAKPDIVDFCQGKLAKHKMPRQIEFREELPKSSVGKILKRILLDEEKQKFQKLEEKRAQRKAQKSESSGE